uniref:Cyclase family protein n=1 Tax=Aegilops tauschii subsp. strangulata TaxID=200361 RepID=A0A453L1Y9_AEGTS
PSRRRHRTVRPSGLPEPAGVVRRGARAGAGAPGDARRGPHPGLLVDVPRDQNITAKTMESLHIPKGVQRVLFRTLNTDRNLMWKKEFDTSYVGFMKDGAQWLVDNTDIKLVGIDYLSVAAFDDLIPSHLVFLENRDVILVEGLKLENVKPGIYSLHCLPLRLRGAEGSPIRCILIK